METHQEDVEMAKQKHQKNPKLYGSDLNLLFSPKEVEEILAIEPYNSPISAG